MHIPGFSGKGRQKGPKAQGTLQSVCLIIFSFIVDFHLPLDYFLMRYIRSWKFYFLQAPGAPSAHKRPRKLKASDL